MASYIAAADSNFNTGSTWHLVDATSMLDSEAAHATELTTSYTRCTAFTPGAIEIDGIAVKLESRAVGAYTVSLELWNATDSVQVAGSEVTINLNDIATSASTSTNEIGWVFFKFGSPITLEAAHNYQVGLKESNAAANVIPFANAGTNWSRMLRTTTDAASPPAAGSILHIMEEKTGAGAATTRTVTMDAIAGAITKYGSGSDGTVALTISDGGTLAYGNSAATAYYLQLDGNLIVYNGGTLTIGTTGAGAIPRDSTAVLEFDPTADGGMGLIIRNGATFTAQGLSRTVGKNVVSGLLNVDTVNGEGHFHLNTDSGWLSGDVVGIASTSRTYTDCETKILNGDAGAEICNVTVNFGAVIHSGTSPIQAEVILLTRNVKIRSSSATVMTYCNFKQTAVVDIDWVEFNYLGENTQGKRGVVTEMTTSSSIRYCSIHDCEDGGFYSVQTGENTTFAYNNLYSCASITASSLVAEASEATVSTVVDNNIIMKSAASSNNRGILLSSMSYISSSVTITNNTICGINGAGIYFGYGGSTFSNNTVHSCASYGLNIPVSAGVGAYSVPTITSFVAWRNSSYGISMNGTNPMEDIIFDSPILFGNYSANIHFSVSVSNVTIESLTSNGDSTFATSSGIYVTPNVIIKDLFINNSDFSTVGGIKTVHASDIHLGTTEGVTCNINLNNCKLGGTNQVANNSYLSSGNREVYYIHSAKHNQTTGAALVHKSWFKYGTVETDLTLFNTATPSMKITPNNASNKIESGSFKVNVNSGQTCTPSVYTRKSEAAEGDTADYNGNHQRLILKRNDAIGIAADAVIDTAAGAIGDPWEQLTGTTAAATEDGVMEFIVDCDGTTGFVNVDDFTATVT